MSYLWVTPYQYDQISYPLCYPLLVNILYLFPQFE